MSMRNVQQPLGGGGGDSSAETGAALALLERALLLLGDPETAPLAPVDTAAALQLQQLALEAAALAAALEQA